MNSITIWRNSTRRGSDWLVPLHLARWLHRNDAAFRGHAVAFLEEGPQTVDDDGLQSRTYTMSEFKIRRSKKRYNAEKEWIRTTGWHVTRQVVFKVLLTRKSWSCGLVRILYTKTELVFMSAEPREQPDVCHPVKQVLYRVTQQVSDLGWVDLDLGSSLL